MFVSQGWLIISPSGETHLKFRGTSLFEVHVGREGFSMVATWFTALMSTWPTGLHAGRSEFFIQGLRAIPFFAFAALEFLWQKSEAAHGEKDRWQLIWYKKIKEYWDLCVVPWTIIITNSYLIKNYRVNVS